MRVLIAVIVYFVILFLRARSTKRGFNRSNIITSVTESLGAVLLVELAFKMLSLAAIGKKDISSILLTSEREYLYIGMYLLALIVDFIRVNWGRWKRAQSR